MAKGKRKQWHPIFAHLLRPIVEDYFEVRTDVPVGEKPRQADIVLLQRTGSGPLPFRGVWSNLTSENILEFKGPTVAPRVHDLDRLVELGLGIDLRLREERVKQRKKPRTPEDVSLWYIANRLGESFLRAAAGRFGSLEAQGPGVWRSGLMQRVIFLISGSDLPIDEDSLPLHVVSREPADKELAVAKFVVEVPGRVATYGFWLAMFHQESWRKVEAMATTTRGFKPDWDGLFRWLRKTGGIEGLGLKRVIDVVGVKQVIDEVGVKQVIDEVGVKQVIDEVGVKQVIDEIGMKRVLEEAAADDIISNFSPAKLRELKRRLESS